MYEPNRNSLQTPALADYEKVKKALKSRAKITKIAGKKIEFIHENGSQPSVIDASQTWRLSLRVWKFYG